MGVQSIQAGATDLLLLPGGLLIKSGDQPIAAIGVSGAPQSAEDEACGRAALEVIQNRLVSSESSSTD
ncbi:heme-binding protein [Hyphomonas sp. KY3]|uniref:heme-binding protein n=1 Tax=Hyphomonas sp. KY3 TaxID=2016196 RepID=UPI00353020D2